jgi:hypothetical protein
VSLAGSRRRSAGRSLRAIRSASAGRVSSRRATPYGAAAVPALRKRVSAASICSTSAWRRARTWSGSRVQGSHLGFIREAGLRARL